MIQRFAQAVWVGAVSPEVEEGSSVDPETI